MVRPDKRLEAGDVVTDHYAHLTQRGHERHGYTGARCVWAITTGRTGTMWLRDLVSQLGSFIACHEPHPSLFYEHSRHMVGDCPGDAACDRVLRVARGSLVRQAAAHHWVYVDTSAMLSHLAPCLLRAFPQSRFLHLVRDPRAFVRSAVPRSWCRLDTVQGHWWPWDDAPAAVANATDLPTVPVFDRREEQWQRLVRFWVAVHQRGVELERELGDRVFRLRAEDMWTDPALLAAVITWCGYPQTDRLDGVIRAAQEQPINVAKKKAKWKRERERFLQDVAGDLLDELGYAEPAQ